MRIPRPLFRPFAARRRRRASFTLIELLVAVGLTSIMLWGILRLFTSATRFSSTISVEAELCATARAVLDRVTREISSAATLDNGYIQLPPANETSDLDTIQFVAPVVGPVGGGSGDEVQLCHVRYHVDTGNNMLLRSTRLPYQAALDPKLQELESPPSNYAQMATFGLQVERFNIQYLTASGAVGTTYGELTQMPRAILVEIRVRDPQNRAVVTLTSSAPLYGSGI